MKKEILFILITIICLTNPTFGQDFSVVETSFKNDSLTLFADIYTPNKTEKKVGIALIQGSGNSDRTNLWSKAFAEFLAENGYYVLLPDKSNFVLYIFLQILNYH